eukprot:tig00000655_g2837.t1
MSALFAPSLSAPPARLWVPELAWRRSPIAAHGAAASRPSVRAARPDGIRQRVFAVDRHQQSVSLKSSDWLRGNAFFGGVAFPRAAAPAPQRPPVVPDIRQEGEDGSSAAPAEVADAPPAPKPKARRRRVASAPAQSTQHRRTSHTSHERQARHTWAPRRRAEQHTAPAPRAVQTVNAAPGAAPPKHFGLFSGLGVVGRVVAFLIPFVLGYLFSKLMGILRPPKPPRRPEGGGTLKRGGSNRDLHLGRYAPDGGASAKQAPRAAPSLMDLRMKKLPTPSAEQIAAARERRARWRTRTGDLAQVPGQAQAQPTSPPASPESASASPPAPAASSSSSSSSSSDSNPSPPSNSNSGSSSA